MNIDSQNIGQNLASVDAASKLNVEQTSVQQTTGKADQEQQLSKVNSVSAEIERRQAVEVTPDQIDTAVSEISEFIQSSGRQLNFSVDEDSQKQIVKVTDSESGEVIRQIPSEEILQLSDRLRELHTDVGSAVGVLFNKQA